MDGCSSCLDRRSGAREESHGRSTRASQYTPTSHMAVGCWFTTGIWARFKPFDRGSSILLVPIMPRQSRGRRTVKMCSTFCSRRWKDIQIGRRWKFYELEFNWSEAGLGPQTRQPKLRSILMLTNGRELYGSRVDRSLWYVERHEVHPCQVCGGALHVEQVPASDYRAVVVASEPITSDEDWKEVPDGSLYRLGPDIEISFEPLD